MAATVRFKGLSGKSRYDYRDGVTEKYRSYHDTPQLNYYSALNEAENATGGLVLPTRAAPYPNQAINALYAEAAQGAPHSKSWRIWDWTVNYIAPSPLEYAIFEQAADGFANPLLATPIISTSYREQERVIDKAYNLDALSHGDGKGGARAINTLGPIVNAAGQQPGTAFVDIDHLDVVTITKNYPNEAAIRTQNRAFRRSVNSDSILGYSAGQLRYEKTVADGGIQSLNGITFVRGITSLLADETHELTIDNVGYHFWDVAESKLARAREKYPDGEGTAEPINLKLDGDKGGDGTTTITYRYLNPIAYAALPVIYF